MEGGSVVEGDRFLLPPEGWSGEACSEFASLLRSLFPEGPLPALNIRPDSSEGRGSRAVAALGVLSGSNLLQLLGGQGGGEGPVAGVGPGCPGTGSPPVLRVSPGDLVLTQGEVCGLVVTGGDLLLAGTAHFRGMALVEGGLTIRNEATLEGMARIQGGLVLKDRAVLRGSACPALRALARIVEIAPIVPLSLLEDRGPYGIPEPLP